MAAKQYILINPAGEPLGTKRQILKTLADYNTAPDGSKEAMGVAFGPGFHVELPWVDEKDDIQQAAITVADQDGAWPVLSRLFKNVGWRMMDIESGHIFGDSAD